MKESDADQSLLRSLKTNLKWLPLIKFRFMKSLEQKEDDNGGTDNATEENPLKGNLTPPLSIAEVTRDQTYKTGHELKMMDLKMKTTDTITEDIERNDVSSVRRHLHSEKTNAPNPFKSFYNFDKSPRNRRTVNENPYMMRESIPQFRLTPIEQTVSSGSQVSLKCSAIGTPMPVLSWTRNNMPLLTDQRTIIGSFHLLSGEVVSTVNISDIVTRDGGIIRCVAKNLIGSSSHLTRLNVYGPPFIRRMHNASFLTGDDGMVSCPIGGFPIPVVSWMRNGLALMPNRRISVLGNNTLLFTNVKKSDEATYTCMAEGRQGQIARGDMYLKVVEAPVVSHFSFPKDLQEGDRTQLTCIISSGDLPININILKDGRQITHDPGIEMKRISDFSSVLLFQSLKEYHAGKYACIASNTGASANVSTTLSVKYSPKWIAKPGEKKEIEAGKTAVLDCQVRGIPKPRISWKKKLDGPTSSFITIVQDNIRFSLAVNGSLIIFNVRKEDEMVYICQASNGIGSHLQSSTRIFVKVKPSIVSEGGKTSAHVGHPIELRCESSGDYPLIIIWVKGNNEVMGTRRISIRESKSSYSSVVSTLQIHRIESSDRGIYHCRATNQHGFQMKEFEVVVLEPPIAPTNLVVENIRSRSVSLRWNLLQPAAVAIQYKEKKDSSWTVNSRNVSVGEWSKAHILSSLQPFTKYAARVFAFNELGTSHPSKEIVFTTDEEAPSGAPKDVRVSSVGAFSLLVSWRSPPDLSSHGLLRGYIISLRKQNFNDSPVVIARPNNSGGFSIVEEYLIKGLSPNTLYEIAIKAFNRIGRGPLSSPRIVVSTNEAVPVCPPTGVLCRDSVIGMRVWWRPPPASCINGHITGYTITSTQVDAQLAIDSSTRSVQTTNLEKSLTNLPSASNISVMVMAHTSAGMGPPSTTLYCVTHDVVPDPPDNFRVYSMDTNSLLATWSPPKIRKGRIIHYTLYYLQDSYQELTERYVIDASSIDSTWKIITGLQEGAMVQVWITALNDAGESLTSPKIVRKPEGSTFEPVVVGKRSNLAVNEGEDVTLTCRGFGSPSPSIEWTHDGFTVVEDRDHQLLHQGDLHINAVRHNATYTCYARSREGSSNFNYNIEVLQPPLVPSIFVHGSTWNSLNLSLVAESAGKLPILGHIIFMKIETGDWKEIIFPPFEATASIVHTIKNLRCGSSYHFYGISWNKLGTSKSSSPLIGLTRGEPPPKPSPNKIVEVNTTCVTLRLYTWPESGCQITYYKVEFRKKDEREWHIYNREVKRDEMDIGLCSLNRGQSYILKLSAVSEAGSRTVLYEVTTYDPILGWITAEPVQEVHLAKEQLLEAWFDVHVIAGMISSILLISAMVICACVFCRKRSSFMSRNTTSGGTLERKKLGEFCTKEDDAMYIRSTDISCDTILKKELASYSTLQRECDNEIYPYATYRESVDNTLEYGMALRSHSPTSKGVFDGISCNPETIYISARNEAQYTDIDYVKQAPCSPSSKKKSAAEGTSYGFMGELKPAYLKRHNRVPIISKESMKPESSSDSNDCYGITLPIDRKESFLRRKLAKERIIFKSRRTPNASFQSSGADPRQTTKAPYAGRPVLPAGNFFKSRKSEDIIAASSPAGQIVCVENADHKQTCDPHTATTSFSINV